MDLSDGTQERWPAEPIICPSAFWRKLQKALVTARASIYSRYSARAPVFKDAHGQVESSIFCRLPTSKKYTALTSLTLYSNQEAAPGWEEKTNQLNVKSWKSEPTTSLSKPVQHNEKHQEGQPRTFLICPKTPKHRTVTVKPSGWREPARSPTCGLTKAQSKANRGELAHSRCQTIWAAYTNTSRNKGCSSRRTN